MTWRGVGPSGHIATIDVGGGVAKFSYETPGGDASGVIDNIIVIGLRGRPISESVPVFGDVLSWDGSTWSPGAVSGVASTGVGPHKLLSSIHIDTTASDPTAWDLIAGSGSPATWIRFPIGQPNQQLRVSDAGQLVWAHDPLQIVESGSSVALTSTSHRVVINKTAGSPTSVAMPVSPFLGQEILIKDGKGDSSSNTISVSASGTTIDGQGVIQIRTNYQSIHFMYNGTEWNII